MYENQWCLFYHVTHTQLKWWQSLFFWANYPFKITFIESHIKAPERFSIETVSITALPTNDRKKNYCNEKVTAELPLMDIIQKYFWNGFHCLLANIITQCTFSAQRTPVLSRNLGNSCYSNPSGLHSVEWPAEDEVCGARFASLKTMFQILTSNLLQCGTRCRG